MSPTDNRSELLLHMYDQMFNDINTHILVVWQSVGVLVGAFAVLTLVEKKIITMDIAATLIVLISAWLLAHLYDASYWYNRNLVIIANIEKQFLQVDDLKMIHYYFGKPRPKNKMITHFRIQFALGVGVIAIFLSYHLFTKILPMFGTPISTWGLQWMLPYVFLIFSIFYLYRLCGNRNRAYEEVLLNSPGSTVDTSGIVYGEGHGFPRKSSDSDNGSLDTTLREGGSTKEKQ